MNTVKFYLGKRAKNTPKTKIPVVLAFNYAATRLYTQIGIRVIEEEWDSKKQRVKSKVSGSLETNMFLDRLENEIREIYMKGLAAGVTISNQYILSRLSIKKKSVEQSTSSFFADWERYFDVKKNECTVDALKSARVSYNHFREFCRIKHLSPTYDDITPDLLTDFRNYLLKLNQVNNTSFSIIKKMRIFLNWSYRLGKHKNILHREFKLKEYKGNVHFLTWEELMKIYRFEKLTEYEKQVRDFFCWGAFTGLRFSDSLQLRRTDIKELPIGETKAFFAEIRERKTSALNSLPLMGEAIEIINRYKDLPGNKALPEMNMQVVNRYIKSIAKRAGINDTISIDKFKGNRNERVVMPKHRKISSHWGRKTFVSNCLKRKMPFTTIMSITGHKSFKSFGHYFSVQNEDKFQQLRECFPADTDNPGEQ